MFFTFSQPQHVLNMFFIFWRFSASCSYKKGSYIKKKSLCQAGEAQKAETEIKAAKIHAMGTGANLGERKDPVEERHCCGPMPHWGFKGLSVGLYLYLPITSLPLSPSSLSRVHKINSAVS